MAVFGVTIVAILFAAFDRSTEDVLAKHGLDGMEISEMVEHLEATTLDSEELVAAVDGEKLYLVTEKETIKLPIENDMFYLSFAPYRIATHPCATHNLTTCQGELTNEPFEVLVESEGEILFEGTVTTRDNGFKGIWLDRDREATIHVSQGEYEASATITTYADSPTCLTTLRLE